jgi:hypothetical protein
MPQFGGRSACRFLDRLNKKILPPKLAGRIRQAGKKRRIVARLTKETA